jgi:adenylate cyclase
MNLILKNKICPKTGFILAGVLFLLVAIFWFVRGDIWTTWDYQVLDRFYQKAIQEGYGTRVSPNISMIVETDQTKEHFGQTILNRKIYASLNKSLVSLKPEATIYDFIFRFERDTESNKEFNRSLLELGKVYLPLGLNMEDENPYTPQEEKWNSRQLLPFMGMPIQKGAIAPIYAYPSLIPFQDYVNESFTKGHINIQSDSDGVYRHYPLLLKLELGYLPALPFSTFLQNINVALEEIIVDWGREITILAKAKNKLSQDLVIPIDRQGRVYIPFSDFFENEKKSFKMMSLESFLTYSEDINFEKSLQEQFGGAFVFVGSSSQNEQNIGKTALGDRVPLVLFHAAFLNSLLTESFYKDWSLVEALILVFTISFLFTYAAIYKSTKYLYSCGVLSIIGLTALTWFQFIDFRLFPLISTTGSVLFMLSGMAVGISQKTNEHIG